MNALTNYQLTTCRKTPEEFVEENPHESTYALLVRSEEKRRTAFEIVLYILCVLSALAAIWQFVQQPNALPLTSINTAAVETNLPTSAAPV
jgi:hypothetical protein